MAYKILICDGLAYYRAIACDALQNSEYCVVAEANNGKEAVEFYVKHHPDLVLLAITMPEMDGITTLKKILEIDKAAVVVMYAALGQQAQVNECIELGAKNAVFKPCFPKRLLETLKKTLP